MSDKGTLLYIVESVLFVLSVGLLSVAANEVLATSLVEKAAGWSP